MAFGWLRGLDLNQRPLGYEPNELPGCSTPHFDNNSEGGERQIFGLLNAITLMLCDLAGNRRVAQIACCWFILGFWNFQRQPPILCRRMSRAHPSYAGEDRSGDSRERSPFPDLFGSPSGHG